MVEVKQLSYFVAVVEAKSLTAAADFLHIAQPALSQHIQRVEHEFGQSLLIRHSRGVMPTEAGLRLFEHARSILSALDSAKDDLRSLTEDPIRQIRVGMPGSLIEALAIDLMANWKNEHNDVHLRFVERTSHSLNEMVMAGQLDIALSSYPSDPTKLASESLVQDKFCALVPRENPVGSLIAGIRFSDLCELPLIMSSSQYPSRQLMEMTGSYSQSALSVAHEVDSERLANQMVIEGYGVTIRPFLAARVFIDHPQIEIRNIVLPSVTRRLHMVRPANRYMPVYISAFRKMVRQKTLALVEQYPEMVEIDNYQSIQL